MLSTYLNEPPPGVTPKYLVIDSEELMADLPTIILNVNGYPCVSAYDAAEAIAKARQFHPKFILVGAWFRDKNGVDAVIRMQQEQPE